jgi:hypothetical protein
MKAPKGIRSKTSNSRPYSKGPVSTPGRMSEKNGSIRFPTIAFGSTNGAMKSKPTSDASCGSHTIHAISATDIVVKRVPKTNCPTRFVKQIVLDNCVVEMAGIEPASERFDPRNSTSVACRGFSSQGSRRAGNPVTIC